MQFSNLALSRRLERAEGFACAECADARRRLFPDSGAEWIECAGTYAVFNGVNSPITQTFGLGLFEELTSSALDTIETFFFDRGADVIHEVSPFAGVAALDLLCARAYRPIEISSVMYRPVEVPPVGLTGSLSVRVISNDEASLWADISARGWSSGDPDLMEFIREYGGISTACEDNRCFIAEIDGQPGAAGALWIHEGVALFGGAATIPEMRRRGLQGALLQERMRYAAEQGCDLAMMVAEAGSESQRNTERKGFQIAYTRLKWRKPHRVPSTI
ncbi:GNAT family N-acetyltransferase [Nevskia soli]|jgi:GNAT superfamily N-acetyltransferase|uniref:GNAT family N-acetyltransferase n=1 Tax=Nevskia soli TaxID=418856 RepID=UPI0015D95962|nr:GNAT family N-acetyltransferase [Nevskia soli]